MDLSCLGLSGSSQQVLGHLLRSGERSIAQLAVETGIADSVVSRAVRDLARRELIQYRGGRPACVALAPDVAAAVRAMADQARESGERRAAALEALGDELRPLGPRADVADPRYWLVPLRADAVQLEMEARRVWREYASCVPDGRRPRGFGRKVVAHERVRWRVLVAREWPANAAVPRRAELEVRRRTGPMPWLEVADDRAAGLEVVVQGCLRTAWCTDPGQVALARAAFERWWDGAEPVALPQSTRAAQPLDRATAARQRR